MTGTCPACTAILRCITLRLPPSAHGIPVAILRMVTFHCKEEGTTGLANDSIHAMQVAHEGTKKTVFTNYMELCKAMNRQPEHVQLFVLAELGTSGSLDGQSRLIVKGRFQPKACFGAMSTSKFGLVVVHYCKIALICHQVTPDCMHAPLNSNENLYCHCNIASCMCCCVVAVVECSAVCCQAYAEPVLVLQVCAV